MAYIKITSLSKDVIIKMMSQLSDLAFNMNGELVYINENVDETLFDPKAEQIPNLLKIISYTTMPI